MISPSTVLFYGLSTHATLTLAGNCISFNPDPGDDSPAPAPAPVLTWATCKNRPASGAQWACQDPSIIFPTVGCLTADMKTCGNVGVNTIFYSFGATVTEIKTTFSTTLQPPGVMFNDALDSQYWTDVLSANPNFRLDDIPRMQVFVARYAEAMAQASTGKAYVVVGQRNGEGGGVGAYQLPTDTSSTNVWRAYEFPTLQQNTAISSVASVDQSNDFSQTIDWQPDDGNEILPYVDADTLNVLAAPPCNANSKRDGSACAVCTTVASPSGSNSTAANSTSANSTATNTTSALSSSSTGLYSNTTTSSTPPSSSAGPYSNSTTSSTPPSSSAEPSSNSTTTSTPSSSSMRTTSDSKTSPTPSSSSTPSSPSAQPSTVVQLSNNSISVGTLGGSQLYNAMWNALMPKCPNPQNGAPTSCQSTAAIVSSVGTIAGGTLTEGEIIFTIADSSYTSTGQLDAMMGAAVRAFQQSATGKNCKAVTWVEQSGEPCKKNRVRMKRIDMPAAYECTGQETLCTAADLITVELNDPNQPEAAHLNIEVSFQLEGDSDFLEFLCEIIIDGVGALLTTAAPEVAPEDWALLGEILPCCQGHCLGSS